ncbi:unnamed protein product [Arabis nemorensis]|uniref:Uncharacterized protein n=1 Tax=Arabis nemorensis TaxID=586526 RepID=A0A565CBX8_9BRAS|nr:unnamed protein product [Arabis nemorensis]
MSIRSSEFDPRTIYDSIKETLESEGFEGINTEGTKQMRNLLACYWTLKNRAPGNLIILSKDMVPDKIFHFEALYS